MLNLMKALKDYEPQLGIEEESIKYMLESQTQACLRNNVGLLQPKSEHNKACWAVIYKFAFGN